MSELRADNFEQQLSKLLAQGRQLDTEFKQTGIDVPRRAALLARVYPWFSECVAFGRLLPDPSGERTALQSRVDYWSSLLAREGRALVDTDRLADFDPTVGIVLIEKCPYPGLAPYTETRRKDFFGREPLISECVAHLENPARGILLLVGGSGSGKSSLALAGVRPKLQELHKGAWLFAPPFTPGDRPLALLATSVADAIEQPDRKDAIERSLTDRPGDALTLVAELCRGKPLMLLIDQFEELLTLCRDANQQSCFALALCALSAPAASSGDFSCRILLTLRTDHLARFESSNALKPLHMRLVEEGNHRHLSSISFDDIKRAISEPARRAGLRFESQNLVDQLASQTAGLSNGLPLLQFALCRLWDTRPINEDAEPLDLISKAMVDALPDVQRALGKVADDVYKGFSSTQQRICERLLQELVVLDDTFEEPLRRRRDEGELRRVLDGRFPESTADVITVIDKFVGAGLLRRFGEGDERQLEVAHEALLRHWDRINRLMSDGKVKERLFLVKQISRDAAEWINHRRSDDFLNLRGERLERALGYEKDGWLAERESAEYVTACNAREAKVKEDRQRAEQAERSAREALLKKAQAETREAVAEAKRKRGQLWLTLSCLALVLVAAYTLISKVQDIAARDANLRIRDANLNAFTSLSAHLRPWDALDVASSLAEHAGVKFRFALAHALERMDDTWLLGEDRASGLTPNQDGSALLQFDRKGHKLVIYPVNSDGKPSNPTPIAWPRPFEQLASAHIGPPVGGKMEERLVLLFYLDPRGTGLVGEVLRISADGEKARTPLPYVAQGEQISHIGFGANGAQAVFSVFDPSVKTSTIYRFASDSPDKLERTEVKDPVVARTDGVDARVVSAVAFGGGSGDNRPAYLTGRLDGSVYCEGNALKPPSPPAGLDRTPVVEIASVSGSDLFVFLKKSGAVYTGNCSSRKWTAVGAGGKASWLNLTKMPKDLGGALMLSYFEGEARNVRCLVQADRTGEKWNMEACNSGHSAHLSIPSSRRQLSLEASDIAAVHTYPVEFLAREARNFQGRRAESTVVRWKLPERTEQARNPSGVDPRLAPKGATDTDIPWKKEELGSDSLFVAGNDKRLIKVAALSPNGRRLAWIEFRDAMSHAHLLTDAKSTLQGSKVAQIVWAWQIGDQQPMRLPKQRGQGEIVAINNHGTVAHSQELVDRTELYLDGSVLYSGERGRDHLGNISCLSFSPGGLWLVAGTGGGRVRGYALMLDQQNRMVFDEGRSTPWLKPSFAGDTRTKKNEAKKNETKKDEAKESERRDAKRPTPVTACSVTNDGILVVGSGEGQVAVRRTSRDWKEWEDLTSHVAFQFASPVSAVSVDGDQRYVAALADWQPNSCSRPALPGQALRIWDLTLPDVERRFPVASTCFPNQVVLAIGDVVPKGETLGVPLVAALNPLWHECPGCARKGEEPEAILKRLVGAAGEKKRELLDTATLQERYSLKLQ